MSKIARGRRTMIPFTPKISDLIGDSLSGNEGYLRYLWIQGLQTNQMQVVYVPTEANLPIMESHRLKK